MRSPEMMDKDLRIASLERERQAARLELDRLRFIEATVRTTAGDWRADAAKFPEPVPRAMRSCAEDVEIVLAAAGPPSDYLPTLATRLAGYVARLEAEAIAFSQSAGEAEAKGENQLAGRLHARATVLQGVVRHLDGLVADRRGDDQTPTLETALAQIEQAGASLRAVQQAMVKAGRA